MQKGERQSFQLYQLIGAPLIAFVQAECKVAQTTAEFIQQMGFINSGGTAHPEVTETLGHLRMVTFVHKRRGSDGKLKTYKVEVPLLSLIPIPTLQVKEADIEFSLKIFSLQSQEASKSVGAGATKLTEPSHDPAATGDSSQPPPARAGITNSFLSPVRHEMVGGMGRMPSSDSSGKQSSMETQIKVKVKLEQSDMPAGLGHLLRLMDESINTTIITDETSK